jgi:DNA-binding CsgD family transcriptional regulator
MRKKRKNLWKIIKGIRKQSICMQQRLIVYWCVVILTLFSAAVLLMSILGVIPGMDLKVGEMLSAQQKNTVSAMTEQTDIMMARSISLSEEITKELSQYLTANGKAFSDLNDNPQLIMDLEAALYSSLRSALDVKYCSGVFVILNATVNTETEYADTSRMGIYLRLSDLKAVNTSKQHVVFFRGNAYIARAEQVQLHNRWNLEFDTSALSGYEQIMKFKGNRLAESCLWTDRLKLKDTWEDVQLLYVPVLDSTGKVRGLCGMEMSNLYFRLSYPMVEGSYGNMVTVVAPMDEKGKIYLDKAMFGDTKDTHLSPTGTMTVKNGKHYNTYSATFRKYIGRHELLNLKSCNGMPLAVLTLMSEANYEKLTAENRRAWITGTLIFLFLLLLLSITMSNRFVKPILRSLKALQDDTLTDGNLSGISEVDALVDFMQTKRNTEKLENGGIPPNIEEMLKAFALRVETLTPAERKVLQYYIEGYTIQEIASLLYISIGTARKHNTNMNRKLGITAREELMLYIDLFRKCNQLDKLTYTRTK